MSIVVRPYKGSDWASICRIHDAARHIELTLSSVSAAYLTLEETFDNEGLFDGSVDVAILDGTIAGFIAYMDTEITWLYVDPLYHRRGIAKRLLRHALLHSNHVVTLEVLEGNSPALSLYLSVGFTLVKRMVGQLAGNEAFSVTGLKLQYVRNEVV